MACVFGNCALSCNQSIDCMTHRFEAATRTLAFLFAWGDVVDPTIK